MSLDRVKVIQGPLEGKKFHWADSPLTIQGNLTHCQITADHEILIQGEVRHCRISSSGGGVKISGEAVKSRIHGFSDLFLQSAVAGCDLLSSHGGCYFQASIQNSMISAMSFIFAKESTTIIKSSLSCSLEIDAWQVGELANAEKSVLQLTPRKRQDLFELFFVYQQKLAEKEKDLEKLEREIKVFSLIRDQIQDLPEEKKKELKTKITLWQDLKEEVSRIREEKKRMLAPLDEDDRYNRAILIRKNLFPPVKIQIDGREMMIQNPDQEAGFYKSGIVIRAEIEKIANKRKVFPVG